MKTLLLRSGFLLFCLIQIKLQLRVMKIKVTNFLVFKVYLYNFNELTKCKLFKFYKVSQKKKNILSASMNEQFILSLAV